MGSSQVRERVILEFLERYTVDRLARRSFELSHYLEGFPGFESIIAREFLAQEGVADEPTEADRDVVGRTTPPTPGRKLGGYVIERELGRGGQGTVYLAQDITLRRNVALKVLEPHVAGDPEALLRMQREAEIASRLDHPGVCAVYEFHLGTRSAWIAMRYVEGETLAARWNRDPRGAHTREGLQGTLAILEKTARALHAAHQAGIVHRDIKPGNIIVDIRGEPVILDFGLARDDHRSVTALTASSAILGTPAYIAPEQLWQEKLPPDPRTDVYALGVTLFQTICGRLPFSGSTFAAIAQQILYESPPPPRSLNPLVSRDLAVVMATAMHAHREDRYASALDLADDLRRVYERLPISARPLGLWKRAARFFARRPALAITGSLLLICLLGAIVSLSLLWISERDGVMRLRQMADIRLVRALVDEDRSLWPIAPGLVAKWDDWARRVQDVMSRRDEHRRCRERHRKNGRPTETGWEYDAVADAWIDDQLTELEAQYAALEKLFPGSRNRRDAAAALRHLTVGLAETAWSSCWSDLRADARFTVPPNPHPQVGLVPLGKSPEGYQEFWHTLSGERPERGGFEWRIAEETGIVLVLLPGGAFTFGLPPSAKDSVIDSQRGFPYPNEYGRHEVHLRPFFIAKYELTQAQWMRLQEGVNPSYYRPGRTYAGRRVEDPVTLLHPVQSVTWEDAATTLWRHGLTLPTEVQWEYAARGGTNGFWFTGNHPRQLEEHANIAGKEAQGDRHRGHTPPFDDGQPGLAPVGVFRPNPFGLHDMLGNIWEWCCDPWCENLGREDLTVRLGDGFLQFPARESRRAVRGGSFDTPVQHCRPGMRVPWALTSHERDLGVRPARELEF